MKLIIGYIRSNHDLSMIFVLLCCSEKAILGNNVLVHENVWRAGVYLTPDFKSSQRLSKSAVDISLLKINTVLELYILYIYSLENQFADICYDIFMLTNFISGNKNAFNKQNTFDL